MTDIVKIDRTIILQLRVLLATNNKPTRLKLINLMTGESTILSTSHVKTATYGQHVATWLTEWQDIKVIADSWDKQGNHYFVLHPDTTLEHVTETLRTKTP